MTSLGHPYDELPQDKYEEIGERGEQESKKLAKKQKKEILAKKNEKGKQP